MPAPIMPAPSTTTFFALYVGYPSGRAAPLLMACRSKKNAWIMFFDTWPVARKTKYWVSILDAVSKSTWEPSTAADIRASGAGIGDFRRDTGFGENPLTLAYARSRFTIAAKAAHLPSAIDGPTVGSSALKLSEATSVSVEFGMTGKICLTPEQCAPVNEGLSPSQDDINWAREFFAEFDRDGGEIRNGSDLPRIARATKILDLARSYGITSSSYATDEAGHRAAPSDTYHY